MLISKRKDEEILLEIFLRFLKETEAIVYEVIGENVPNRAGDKNFDYLLRRQSEGSTIALEITLVSDNEGEFKQNRLKDSVLSCLDGTIQAGLHDLPGAILIETPHNFYGSMKTLKREAESVAKTILNTAKAMVPGQEAKVESPLGSFNIQLLEIGTKGVGYCAFGQETWSTHSSDVHIMSSMLRRRLTNKNEQLDTDANRRVMLIGRVAGIIDRDAISDALSAMHGDFSNIDELYVCYGDRDVKQY
jgi:hypothetical protein